MPGCIVHRKGGQLCALRQGSRSPVTAPRRTQPIVGCARSLVDVPTRQGASRRTTMSNATITKSWMEACCPYTSVRHLDVW
jgi:hypothetical protein